jgi:transcriptional regulatory protein RtcR
MGARINTADVSAEIERLRASWDTLAAASRGQPAKFEKLLSGLDDFDRVQLEGVLEACAECGTLAEAGRKLYAVSRQKKRGRQNDTDRLKKYLQKFGLDWNAVKG